MSGSLGSLILVGGFNYISQISFLCIFRGSDDETSNLSYSECYDVFRTMTFRDKKMDCKYNLDWTYECNVALENKESVKVMFGYGEKNEVLARFNGGKPCDYENLAGCYLTNGYSIYFWKGDMMSKMTSEVYPNWDQYLYAYEAASTANESVTVSPVQKTRPSSISFISSSESITSPKFEMKIETFPSSSTVQKTQSTITTGKPTSSPPAEPTSRSTESTTEKKTSLSTLSANRQDVLLSSMSTSLAVSRVMATRQEVSSNMQTTSKWWTWRTIPSTARWETVQPSTSKKELSQNYYNKS